ncbi:MAG: carbohydrate kinase [Propionibacteriaceae bacterium]|jgi:fructokinase|nr:carbohydrate kinase [Propionibacteriaceae bacterium]
MARFVCCGEVLIDLVRQPGGDSTATPWLGLSGGSPLNTAVALARLGQPVRMLTRLGQDGFGSQLADHLSGSGVDLSWAHRVEQPTTLAVVSLDDQGRASYAFHFDQTSSFGWRPEELPVADPQAWLHLASIGWVVEPAAAILRRWLTETATGWAGLSYDINVRPSVMADPDDYWAMVAPLADLVGRAGGVIKASDEDVAFLVRAQAGPSGDVTAVARGWMELWGPAAVVVTRGADGALAVDRSGRVQSCPGRPVELVDTVGAGDTFTAGFLDRYVDRPDDLPGALAWGVAAASLVCQRQGADPPTAAELAASVA